MRHLNFRISRHSLAVALLGAAAPLMPMALLGLLPGCGITTPDYKDYTSGSATGGTTAGTTPTGTITYNGQIGAFLNANCAKSGCHAAGGTSPDLSTYAKAQAQAGKSEAQIAANLMPQGASLSAANKALFKAWVDGGAQQ